MNPLHKLKIQFKLKGLEVARKMAAKVTLCKVNADVDYCRDCQDYRFCTIKRFEVVKKK